MKYAESQVEMVSQSASDWSKMAWEDVPTVQTPCEMRESGETVWAQTQSQRTVCFRMDYLEIASYQLSSTGKKENAEFCHPESQFKWIMPHLMIME